MALRGKQRTEAPADPPDEPFEKTEVLAGIERCEKAARMIFARKYLGFTGDHLDLRQDLLLRRWIELVRFHQMGMNTSVAEVRQKLAGVGINVPEM